MSLSFKFQIYWIIKSLYKLKIIIFLESSDALLIYTVLEENEN